ncbi:aldo/keto reductase [Lunatibacter salilacus]|uniref:aldo/keto reductase n=1 Tax=Lunatibacter salilacus TaxID=2483804 RepID=UPI00131C31E7|nr:aldo/keto reductase [Lunatibacter salilacus]
MKYITFANGDKMPMLGLGTWKSAPGEVFQAVLWALEAGYRHIDCAAIYQNEKEVGEALAKAFSDGLVKREDVFITSKLWNNVHEEHMVEVGLDQTLADLKLDYVDLYLIHWPVSLKSEVMFPKEGDDYLTYEQVPLTSTWSGMEKLKKSGKARHIGVSNFNIAKLNMILQSAELAPEMNQIELHPYLPQYRLLDFCKNKGIAVTAYSPLGSGDRPKGRRSDDDPVLLEEKSIHEIAKKHSVSPAQVLISWAIHRNTAVIPKSVSNERIKQNLASKDIILDSSDMEKIKTINHKFRYIDGSFFTDIPGSPYKQSDLWEEA